MSLTDWKTILGKIGDLTALKTTAKKTIVDAINELKDLTLAPGSASSFLPRTVDQKVAIVNNLNEVVLVALLIPVNSPIGTTINLCVWGKASNQHTAAVNYRFRIKLFSTGGQPILDTGNINVPATAAGSSRKWKVEGKFLVATVSHKIQSEFCMSLAMSDTTTVIPLTTSLAFFGSQLVGWDLSLSTELQITCQMSVANINTSIQLDGAVFN